MSRLSKQFFPHLLRTDRRAFLQKSGLLALLPALSAADRFRLLDILGGEAFAAENQVDQGTIFIEINLRDQWDFGHVFVPPGLARYPLLKRGDQSQETALFEDQSQIVDAGRGFYLTQDGLSLRPHLEHIAHIDTFELCIGRIHGHEAGNALRSPGRTKVPRIGYSLMSSIDSGSELSNEVLYSRTPTPAIVHNYFNNGFALHNGLVMRGIGRSGVFAYHFDGGLVQGQLDRYYSGEELLLAFDPTKAEAKSPINEKQAAYLRDLMQKLDKRFLKQRPYTDQTSSGHMQQLSRMLQSPLVKDFALPLTAEEEKYWLPGIPEQMSPEKKGLDIGRQLAYGFKLIQKGIVRTLSVEFDYADFHGNRNEKVMRTMAKQTALPISRLIQALKDQGLFERTLIAVYTTDGSRSPTSESYGNEGKNSLMLVGGMIQGGYYGDIRVAETLEHGHRFSYHMPDLETGRPVASGALDNSGRLSGASGWLTVMKALRVPESFTKNYPDVADQKALDFVLRSRA